jgi:hypothetical protein
VNGELADQRCESNQPEAGFRKRKHVSPPAKSEIVGTDGAKKGACSLAIIIIRLIFLVARFSLPFSLAIPKHISLSIVVPWLSLCLVHTCSFEVEPRPCSSSIRKAPCSGRCWLNTNDFPSFFKKRTRSCNILTLDNRKDDHKNITFLLRKLTVSISSRVSQFSICFRFSQFVSLRQVYFLLACWLALLLFLRH